MAPPAKASLESLVSIARRILEAHQKLTIATLTAAAGGGDPARVSKVIRAVQVEAGVVPVDEYDRLPLALRQIIRDPRTSHASGAAVATEVGDLVPPQVSLALTAAAKAVRDAIAQERERAESVADEARARARAQVEAAGDRVVDLEATLAAAIADAALAREGATREEARLERALLERDARIAEMTRDLAVRTSERDREAETAAGLRADVERERRDHATTRAESRAALSRAERAEFAGAQQSVRAGELEQQLTELNARLIAAEQGRDAARVAQARLEGRVEELDRARCSPRERERRSAPRERDTSGE